jgi:hypothetical protein
VTRVRDVAAVSAFDDYFARMMPDVEAWFAEHAAEPATARKRVVPAGDPFAWTRRTEPSPIDALEVSAMNAHKLSAVIEVPDELLMDAGLIPDTRPPLPPPTWRTRLRRKLGAWRERAARRAYKSIAGYWPDNGEDDW